MTNNILYLYDDDVGNFFYGHGHPMKPHRVRMTHDLLRSYGLLDRMDLMVPPHPTVDMLTRFHANDYIDFLRSTSEPTSLPLTVRGPSTVASSPDLGFTSSPVNTGSLGSSAPSVIISGTAGYRSYLSSTTGSTTNYSSVSCGTTVGSYNDSGPGGRSDQISRFNVGEDCPVFEGLWEYCKIYSGGSIEGARRVVKGEYQYAINWAGGLHHGKKHEASGFCYVNDCVLGALEFLRYKHRVLYVDVDIHHGDGVEEAFYTSPRVLCCSFHKYGHFFPGTGALDDIGIEEGLGYSVNVPLHDGIDDAMYSTLFTKVMDKIMETYRPEAVVLQCGADSVAGDRLGCFNLSIEGHSEAVRYFCKAGIPALFLGGGGYTLRNVPRCWARETAHILDVDIDPKIPESSVYRGYYGPDAMLEVPTSNMENRNDEAYIDAIYSKVCQSLKDHVFPVCASASPNQCGDEEAPTRMLVLHQEGSDDIREDEPDVEKHFDRPSRRTRG